MKLIFLILCILLIIVFLLFAIRLKVEVMFNSEKPDINITLPKISSFFSIIIDMRNSNFMLKVLFLNKIIIKGKLKKRKNNHNAIQIVRLSDPRDINIDFKYGFKDPFSTGIACGAINIASQFINIDSIKQVPDFMSDKDYIYLDATAKVNIGSTIARLLRNNS
jgi:hypothetical protein